MKKPDSVHNYLSPSRIISSSLLTNTKVHSSLAPTPKNQQFFEKYFSEHIQNQTAQPYFGSSGVEVNGDESLRFSQVRNLRLEQSSIKEVTSPVAKKSSVTQEHDLQRLMERLKEVQVVLQNELKSLQSLLDSTSKYLGDIDKEYGKVKKRIIEYTSRVMDACFAHYKRNMVDWGIYELAQKRGIRVVQEAAAYQLEQRQLLEAIRSNRQVSSLEANNRELEHRIKHYRFTADQMHKIILECAGRHPTFHQDRIEAFQKNLYDLCKF